MHASCRQPESRDPPRNKMTVFGLTSLAVFVVAANALPWTDVIAGHPEHPDVIMDGKIRYAGDGRYKAYMVPPFEANHASFLELLPNGDMLLAWFSGKKEGYSGVAIVLSRLKSGSNQWSNATVVSQRKGYSNQNPVIFSDPKSKMVHLFHSQQPGETQAMPRSEATAKIWTLNSTDLGVTWSKPYELFSKDGSFDRNRMVVRINGEWILPMYYAVSGDKNEYSAGQVTSDGVRWTEWPMKDSNYLVQPSVIRPQPGNSTLFVYYRDRRAQHIYKAESSDDGQTWTAPVKTIFPNNNAGIQARTLLNQHIVLVYNPTTADRHPLRISLSEDGGKTWPYYRDLETGDGPEYSYPCILQTADEWIHISYTFNRQTIKYVKIKEDWIKEESI